MTLIAEFGKVCEQAARVGGQVLRDHWGRVTAREKHPADLVTEADIASQNAIQNVLLTAFPDHGLLGEENQSIPHSRDGYRWIVDPLDGTNNYVHGVPHYAVSIALEQSGTLLAAAVYDPAADDMYAATTQLGAFRNGQPLHVSHTVNLRDALVANSFPPRVDRSHAEVIRFLELLPLCRATRRTGSSALNLAAIAAGQFDAFWSYATFPWDVAAGILLVREAGGVVTGPAGQEFDLENASFAAAATPELHRQLCRVLGADSP